MVSSTCGFYDQGNKMEDKIKDLIKKDIKEFENKNGKVKFTNKVLKMYSINRKKFDNRVN